jgi:type I pantothenate kinase
MTAERDEGPGEADGNTAVLDAVTERLADMARQRRPLVVGLTGSVAVGKSTFCERLMQRLEGMLQVEAVSTDGFLLPNDVLNARGLGMRKGFPESYDADALFDLVARVRREPVVVPVYSHVTYDVDPALARTLAPPDILILEGLGFAPFPDGRSLTDAVDLTIYLDADEADLEDWFAQRFMTLWHAAEGDPASFYAQFRHMDAEQAEVFGRIVWTQINLENLRRHIVHSRPGADILLRKTAGHKLAMVRFQSETQDRNN